MVFPSYLGCPCRMSPPELESEWKTWLFLRISEVLVLEELCEEALGCYLRTEGVPWLQCVYVLSTWVRMGRRQVGSQRSPWESSWVDRVSSQSPWTGAVGRAGRLWSTQWGSWDCWRCDAGYSAILLVEMVKSCPWNPAPAGTWTSSTLLLDNVLLMALESNVGQTSPRVQAGLWNYLKKSSSHSVITEEEQHLFFFFWRTASRKTSHHCLFLIPHHLIQ